MKTILIIILAFCLWPNAKAQTDIPFDGTSYPVMTSWPQRLAAKVDSILTNPLLQTSQLGLQIYDLTADSTLYACGHRQTLRPASTMKLLTAITALEQLGEDYTLNTSLKYTGYISNRTLYGNLWCIGGMDPMFSISDMRFFVNQLRHLGVDTIRGRILSDMSFKEDADFGEGWCWDDDNNVLSPLLIEGKDNFTEQLRRELLRDGVVIIDSVVVNRSKSDNQKGRLVCSRGHSVGELLIQMMKESDNLYAEALFYQIAVKEGGWPAKAKQACNQVKRMIQKADLSPGNYKIADGSGLSLYNYVSAELLTRLLRYTWKRPRMFKQLYGTLPIAGVDGTLKKRMLKGYATGNVHAKTGTVTGISSLAGYCTAANGHQLCFAIINQGILQTAKGRELQDQLCEAMCEK